MSSLHSALVWGMPLVYLAGTLVVALRRATPAAWSAAEAAAAGALAVAVAAVALTAWRLAFEPTNADAGGLAMALLIGLLGWIIVRYSRRYLDGEAGARRYAGALLLTLAAVSVVVLTDHLGVLLLAWAASSLGLHRLLTFYGDRPAALMAAHKKFLASRLAELCMVAALVLIYREAGTLSMTGIAAHVEGLAGLPWTLHGAAILFALAAILKSAQLPVHGWLIQVMEAPTPVSALLHAGVVNLGGFVLIRLAALLSAAPAAQTLLVVVGSLTAVLAGLVMMTRISIKVRLAWSTCAQMGFMLMECGLGLYDLALLHLIAHSLYKAHAFLTAGEAVLDAGRRDLLPVEPARGSGLAARLTAAPLAIALVVASVVGWRTLVPDFEVSGVVVLILGFALAPLLWRPTSSPGSEWARGTMQVLAITQLYLLWHFVFAGLIHGPAPAVSMPLTAWVGLCFSALYIVQTWVLAFPEGSLSRALYPWAYAGFFLDERFTRVTFRIWPARLPARTPFTAAPIVSGEQA